MAFPEPARVKYTRRIVAACALLTILLPAPPPTPPAPTRSAEDEALAVLMSDEPVREEKPIRRFKAGRKIPLSRLRVPGDRRLEQNPASINQVRSASLARAEGIRDFDRGVDDGLALVIFETLMMPDLRVASFNGITPPAHFKFSTVRRQPRFDRRIDRRQRMSHGVTTIRLRDFGVTLRAGSRPDKAARRRGRSRDDDRRGRRSSDYKEIAQAAASRDERRPEHEDPQAGSLVRSHLLPDFDIFTV